LPWYPHDDKRFVSLTLSLLLTQQPHVHTWESLRYVQCTIATIANSCGTTGAFNKATTTTITGRSNNSTAKSYWAAICAWAGWEVPATNRHMATETPVSRQQCSCPLSRRPALTDNAQFMWQQLMMLTSWGLMGMHEW
jgi:hypothetical protein